MKNYVIILLLLSLIPLQLFPQVPAEDAPTLYRLGEDAMRRGELYRAIDYYKESLRYNPDYVEPLHGLAEVFFRIGEYREAQRYVEQAVALAKRNSELTALQGRIYTGLNEFEQAGEVFASILRREPNNLDAQFGIAELEVARGRSRNALEVYLRALHSYPRNKRGLLSAAILYETQDNYREARELIKTAVRYYPNDPTVNALAAAHYRKTGELAGAKDHARRALAVEPANREALQVLIDVYFDRRDYASAIPVLEESLQSTDDVLHWYALGKARAETEDTGGAFRAFTTALRKRPDDEICRIVMEDALLAQLSADSAERLAAAETRFAGAEKYMGENRTELARQEYRRGLELAPYSDEGRLGYGETFKRSGDYGKYLSILRIVEREGKAERAVLDEIEIYESMIDETVSARWGVDQFSIDRDRYRIALFADTDSSSLRHSDSEEALLRYIRTHLYGYEQIDVVHEGRAETFAASFRNARETRADYFMLFSFTEESGTFTVEASVYHGRTGTLLTSLRVFRTGNDRVARASMRLIKDFQALLPIKGRIYRRDNEMVLVDIGRFHGISEEDVVKVVRETDIALKSRRFGLEVAQDDILGEIRITEADELLAEGSLSTASFFDLVNPTDIVFLQNDEKEAENGTAESEEEKNVISSTIYKSLLRIR
jgi:tetratricopeptide (TPR) repeat protein